MSGPNPVPSRTARTTHKGRNAQVLSDLTRHEVELVRGQQDEAVQSLTSPEALYSSDKFNYR